MYALDEEYLDGFERQRSQGSHPFGTRPLSRWMRRLLARAMPRPLCRLLPPKWYFSAL